MRPDLWLDVMRDVAADPRLTDDERTEAMDGLWADYHAELAAERRDQCHE